MSEQVQNPAEEMTKEELSEIAEKSTIYYLLYRKGRRFRVSLFVTLSGSAVYSIALTAFAILETLRDVMFL